MRITFPETLFLCFTSPRCSHFGSSDISDISLYQIECPIEYIDKYILVFLPQNGYDVERQTHLQVSNTFITKPFTNKKGTLNISH